MEPGTDDNNINVSADEGQYGNAGDNDSSHGVCVHNPRARGTRRSPSNSARQTLLTHPRQCPEVWCTCQKRQRETPPSMYGTRRPHH
jgi:hypothetical protein